MLDQIHRGPSRLSWPTTACLELGQGWALSLRYLPLRATQPLPVGIGQRAVCEPRIHACAPANPRLDSPVVSQGKLYSKTRYLAAIVECAASYTAKQWLHRAALGEGFVLRVEPATGASRVQTSIVDGGHQRCCYQDLRC